MSSDRSTDESLLESLLSLHAEPAVSPPVTAADPAHSKKPAKKKSALS
jgi:hypothetical protein